MNENMYEKQQKEKKGNLQSLLVHVLEVIKP